MMKLRFERKKDEGNGIWSFFFEPFEPVEWIAGQSIRLELPRTTWGVDERRFSITSAPFEKHIQITTRLSNSGFKQGLARLKKNDVINGFGIEGTFTWGSRETPRLFLAAGIGITPFRSMLAQNKHDKKPANATLLYSSREEPVLFKDELDAWQSEDPSLIVHYLIGARIGIEKDSSLSAFWLENLVYISGPSAMVDEVGGALLKLGLPKDQLKLDQFTGSFET